MRGDSLIRGNSHLGFHDKGSQPFPLGRPDPGEFETKNLSIRPPHDSLIDAQGPLLILKKQRHFQRDACLDFSERSGSAAVRGNVQHGGFAFEVVVTKEKEATAQGNSATTTLRPSGIT